jgi:hypothetical protein
MPEALQRPGAWSASEGAWMTEGPKYNVIFRTTESETRLSGTGLAIRAVPRPFGLDTRSLVKACFLSLYEAVKPFPHSIHVLGDKLSKDMTIFFELLADQDSSIAVHFGDGDSGESIRKSLSLALSFPDGEWAYFCEDDYLHRPEAFVWIDELIRSRAEVLRFEPYRWFMKLLFRNANKAPLIIHPADYPDRYDPNRRLFGLLFLTRLNHWRQISDTTHTFMAEVSTIRRYEKIIRESSMPPRDFYLSRHMYSHVFFRGRGLCVSPIPGVATHMTEGVMTPLVNWESLLREMLAEVEKVEKSWPVP